VELSGCYTADDGSNRSERRRTCFSIAGKTGRKWRDVGCLVLTCLYVPSFVFPAFLKETVYDKKEVSLVKMRRGKKREDWKTHRSLVVTVNFFFLHTMRLPSGSGSIVRNMLQRVVTLRGKRER